MYLNRKSRIFASFDPESLPFVQENKNEIKRVTNLSLGVRLFCVQYELEIICFHGLKRFDVRAGLERMLQDTLQSLFDIYPFAKHRFHNALIIT